MRWIAMAIGALGLAYILLRPRLGRRKDPLENSGPRLSLAQQRSLERDMNNVVVEMSEMARQITAQLDTRSAKLEALIAEADGKIQQLQQLQQHANPSPPPVSAAQPESLPAVVAHPAEPEPAATAESVDPRHAAVYALADEGLSMQEIAQRLDRPSGEIELILALRAPAGR